MAKQFQRAETVICSAEVKTAAGVLTSPATSMKVAINGPTGASVVAATAMTLDGVGLYHYDYAPATDALLGTYQVKYTAVDGTRTTIQSDSFVLE
jgi:uncharacterized protein YfaS (alpha-2-macroglobulin family)